MRMRLFLAVSLLVAAALPVFAARLHHARTGDMLGENAVMVRSEYTRIATADGAYNIYGEEVVYGISDDIDFTLLFPLVSLGGIEDSLVIGDLDFSLTARAWNWHEDGALMFSSVWFSFAWRSGVSVATGEGKKNPATGETQYYAPFATGRSSFSFGGGYSFPLAALSAHINFFYYSETGDSNEPFEFDLADDHVELALAIEYYFETDIGSPGSALNIGIKPFYEAVARVAWDSSSSMPGRLENSFGLWLRIGPVFRVTCGFDFPVALENPRFLEREFFMSLSAVFR